MRIVAKTSAYRLWMIPSIDQIATGRLDTSWINAIAE